MIPAAQYATLVAETMAEDELLTLVMDAAAAKGWRRYHVRNSKAGIIQGEPGFPDLVLLRRRRLLFVELKREKGRTSEAQREWLAGLLGCDSLSVGVAVWRPSDWLGGTIIRELEREA